MAKPKTTVHWAKSLAPLFRKYGKRKYPLDYKSGYKILAIVVLSSGSTDVLINKIAPRAVQSFSVDERVG